MFLGQDARSGDAGWASSRPGWVLHSFPEARWRPLATPVYSGGDVLKAQSEGHLLPVYSTDGLSLHPGQGRGAAALSSKPRLS